MNSGEIEPSSKLVAYCSNHTGMQNSADRSFISAAAEANLAEIDTAKMVGQKSTDPAVKDFANRMVTDRRKRARNWRAWLR